MPGEITSSVSSLPDATTLADQSGAGNRQLSRIAIQRVNRPSIALDGLRETAPRFGPTKGSGQGTQTLRIARIENAPAMSGGLPSVTSRRSQSSPWNDDISPSPRPPSPNDTAPGQSAPVRPQSTLSWIHETPSEYAGLPAQHRRAPGGTMPPRHEVFRQNPSLVKLKWHDGQAYEIEGLPHDRAYGTKDVAGQIPKRLIGTSTLTSLTRVMSRQNADSPFYKKVTRRDDSGLPSSDDDIDRIRRTTNAIAALVCLQPELGRHLKVELVTGYDANHLYFITPIVQGQTLQSWMDAPDPSTHSREDFAERVERLAPVLQRLASNGFVHGDINAGNIMYEPATGYMVLIDFEKAKEIGPEEAARLKRHFDFDMENLTHLAESMRRAPSRQPVSLQFAEQICSTNFDPSAIEGYNDVESSEDDSSEDNY